MKNVAPGSEFHHFSLPICAVYYNNPTAVLYFFSVYSRVHFSSTTKNWFILEDITVKREKPPGTQDHIASPYKKYV